MKVQIHFHDGEVMPADVLNLQLREPVLKAEALGHANNDLSLVPLTSVHHLVMENGSKPEGPYDADPREDAANEKGGKPRRAVLRFTDPGHEVVKTYLDREFILDGDKVKCRIYDPASGMLEQWLVPLLALKAVFTVKDWNSQEPGPERSTTGEREIYARW